MITLFILSPFRKDFIVAASLASFEIKWLSFRAACHAQPLFYFMESSLKSFCSSGLSPHLSELVAASSFVGPSSGFY